MIELRSPLSGDIEHIGKHAKETWVRERTTSGLESILANPYSRVATIDGEPCFAGGFVDQGNGVALGWALVGNVPRNAFVGVCRVYRRYLETAPFHWIEAHCVETFAPAFKWVRLLGFEQVDGARCFTPDGREFRRFAYKRTI